MTQADHEASNERRARELCGCVLCASPEHQVRRTLINALQPRMLNAPVKACPREKAITAALDAVRDAEREKWAREVQHEIDSCDNAAVCLKFALILSRMGVAL